MARNSKIEVLKELKDTKGMLNDSFDSVLGNVTTTKKEFEELKEKLSAYPDFVIKREIDLLNIKKKLATVLNEKNLQDQLDVGIAYLDSLLLDTHKE